MIRIATTLLALTLALPALAVEAAAPREPLVEPSVAQVVARMQDFYERTRGFDTRFEQRFEQAGMPSRFAGATAKGRLRFGKPSGEQGPFMRWDYDDGRILLLVKNRSWTFDPDSKQAIEYPVSQAQLSAAVSFLWGKGKLSEEFVITRSTRPDWAKLGYALELTPKKPASGFSRVGLVVDPATGLVRTSIVVQANGGENRVAFVAPKLDAPFESSAFDPKTAFPAGTVRTQGAVPSAK